MGLSQTAISVCNDGNVAQLDCTDVINGGVYYRIEVYRASQPKGGFGITLSGSRAEHITGLDHLKPRSNQVFRYTFSVGDFHKTPKTELPTLLEGREEFNPPGMPNGSWDVRLRDLDAASPSYGSILRVTVAPTGDGHYDLHYEFRVAEGVKPVAISSPLQGKLTDLNDTLIDLGEPLDKHPKPVGLATGARLLALDRAPEPLRVTAGMTTKQVDDSFQAVHELILHQQFATFRKNLDLYEAFGDFGAKAVHPGTNLTGPNAALAAESIYVREYRAALVVIGRVASPDMARGAGKPLSLAEAETNTRPGVYNIFVGATINDIGIYKLGLDKVHSDYGGIPMKLAPGSRLEDGAEPVADAWTCNETLGRIANTFYLAK
jgi:hypothetical protein